MRTRIFCLIVAALFAFSTSQSLRAQPPKKIKPNIVVFLCDDLGYGDLGCYGHPKIKTPNLDKLANSGIRFTDFYSAAPVCSPSRVGLLTGRSPNKAGVFDWIPASNGKPRGNAREQVHMRKSETTIAKLLRRGGYETMLSGKWHCNSRFNQKAQPQPGDFGFDHWFATQNNAAPSHQNPVNFVRNGKKVGPREGFSCQLVVDEAVQWLNDRKNPEKPFFMFVAFHEPHEPVASPKKLVEKYKSVAKNEDQAQYFANVENVDIAVGKLVAELDRKKLREKTLIIFTSDNGPETLKRYRSAHRSYGNPGELRGMKLHTHEAGFRVAGIMNWQGKIEPNQVSNEAVSSLDFLPTFCKLAEVVVPEKIELDGTDLMPAVMKKTIRRQKPLVWCYYNAINEARVAMRDGKYKVLARLEPKSGGKLPRFQNLTTKDVEKIQNVKLTDLEVYDLSKDISEKTNLANKKSASIRILSDKLNDEYQKLVKSSHFWTPAKSPSGKKK